MWLFSPSLNYIHIYIFFDELLFFVLFHIVPRCCSFLCTCKPRYNHVFTTVFCERHFLCKPTWLNRVDIESELVKSPDHFHIDIFSACWHLIASMSTEHCFCSVFFSPIYYYCQFLHCPFCRSLNTFFSFYALFCIIES